MNKSSLTIAPAWHIPAVLVLLFAVAMPFADMAMPHASHLVAQGRSDVAVYFNAIPLTIFVIAFFVLLPRRHNTSGLAVVGMLGRMPLLVRYFLLVGLGAGLFWLGILYERLSA